MWHKERTYPYKAVKITNEATFVQASHAKVRTPHEKHRGIRTLRGSILFQKVSGPEIPK
jgi:hypothetical protein